MAKIIRKSFRNATKKKLIREFILQSFEFEKVIGLAGPDIDDYVNYLESKGATQFEIYETNPEILEIQKAKIELNKNLELIHNDILQAIPNEKKTLYDLDFCESVKYLQQHISKFKENFIMTFSTRIGIEYTINTFFNARKEQIISKKELSEPFSHFIFTTNVSEYIFVRYKDTAPMCCFAKLN